MDAFLFVLTVALIGYFTHEGAHICYKAVRRPSDPILRRVIEVAFGLLITAVACGIGLVIITSIFTL